MLRSFNLWILSRLGIGNILKSLARIEKKMEELKAIIAQLASAVDSLSSTVVAEIVQINEKLASLGNPDLSESIAQLADLAARVNAVNIQVAGIIPDDVPVEPVEPVEPEA